MADPPQQFKLSSSEGSFSSRTNDVFASLDAIEQKHNAKERAREKFSHDRHKYMKEDPSVDVEKAATSSASNKSCWERARSDYRDRNDYGDRTNIRDRYQEERNLDNKEHNPDYKERSLDNKEHKIDFKAPRGRAPRRSYVPDFRVNPQKYTMYDLSDVSSDQMSNSTNTAAAFEFLQQRREQKEASDTSLDKAGDPGKHTVVFKKPKKQSQTVRKSTELTTDETKLENSPDNDSSVTSTSYDAGKIKMKEYVVGQKPTTSKKVKKISGPIAAADKIGLHHLFEEDEEDEDDIETETSVKMETFTKQGGSRKRRLSNQDSDSE